MKNGYNPSLLDILAGLAVIAAIYSIINKNPILSVIFLIGLFGIISLDLILINLTFIGLSYILVYIGAISILFLFILMLINIRISELISTNNNYMPLAIFSLITIIYTLGKNMYTNEINYKEVIDFSTGANWENVLIDISHINAIGNIMYSSFFIWLIIISLILLLSMVGSIIITINK